MRYVLPLVILAISVQISACTSERQSSNENDLLALVEQFYEEFDAELSLDVVDRWLAPSYQNHSAGTAEPMDLAAYRELLTLFFDGFTDIRHVVTESVVSHDRIAIYVDASMIHTGDFQGFAPTGRTINVSEMIILRWEEDKIAEEWIVFDFATFMQQLESQEE